MAITKISPLPPAPDRNDPVTFRPKGDAMMTALVTKFEPELNDAIDGINETGAVVDSSSVASLIAAQNAAASAQSAAAVASAVPWVSGTTYSINSCVISQVNFQTYRKRTSAAGSATDPANDNTNWRIVASGSNTFVPVVVTGSSIDLRLGSVFIKSVSGNISLSIDNCPPDGVSFTLELNVVSGSVTFTQAANIKTPYDAPVTLKAGKTYELLFITMNGGGRWRMVPVNEFTT